MDKIMGWTSKRESAPITCEGAARVFLDRIGCRVDYAMVGPRETANGRPAFACEFVAVGHNGQNVAGIMLLEVSGDEWADKWMGEDEGPAEPPSFDLVTYCESIGHAPATEWARQWRDRATDWETLVARTVYA